MRNGKVLFPTLFMNIFLESFNLVYYIIPCGKALFCMTQDLNAFYPVINIESGFQEFKGLPTFKARGPTAKVSPAYIVLFKKAASLGRTCLSFMGPWPKQ